VQLFCTFKNQKKIKIFFCSKKNLNFQCATFLHIKNQKKRILLGKKTASTTTSPLVCCSRGTPGCRHASISHARRRRPYVRGNVTSRGTRGALQYCCVDDYTSNLFQQISYYCSTCKNLQKLFLRYLR